MKTPAAVCVAAGIARKWEGERRVRHPRVVHTDKPVGVAFCLTTMMYDSGGREANRAVDFRHRTVAASPHGLDRLLEFNLPHQRPDDLHDRPALDPGGVQGDGEALRADQFLGPVSFEE